MHHQGTMPIWSWPGGLDAARLAAEPPREHVSCRGIAVPRAASPSPTVLIVDDEQMLAGAACSYLARRGYDVHLAASGEDALARMQQSELDLVVLDYGLPGIDGLETLRRLRQISPSAQVIMMSGHGTDATADEAIRLGAFGYLAKPIDLVELGVVLDTACARARKNRAFAVSPDYEIG